MNPRLPAPEVEQPLAIAPPRPWYQRPALDRPSQAFIHELMYGNEAQAAFRDRGEQGYVEYVNQGFMNASHLAGFALQQYQRPSQPEANAPSERRVQIARNAGAAGDRPASAAHADAAAPSPPLVVTPTGEDRAKQEREQRLRDATLRYAGLIATRRASHGDALLERQRQRGRAGRVMARVIGAVINPAEIGDYGRAERLARNSSEAADEYRRQVEAYISTEPRNHDQEVNARRDLMDQFETAVQGEALAQTYPRRRQDGSRYRNRWDNLRVRMAQSWFSGGKVRRAVIVAPWAVGAGAVIGLAVGAASWPVIVVGGVGALLAGESIGGAIASTVSRFQAAHPPTHELHGQQAMARNLSRANFLHVHLTPTEEQLDLTRVYESATVARAAENLRRKRRAEALGAVAAGAAFGVAAWSVANLRPILNQGQGAHPGAAHSPTPSPTHPTPTPNTTPTPTVNVHDAPWNVAHQLQPGHEWNLINNTMQHYNAAHGTHLHLVENANGTHWTWIEDGARALNPSQQTVFNQLMQTLAPHTP